MTDVVIVVLLVAMIAAIPGLFLLQRRLRRRRTAVDLSALQLQYAPGSMEIARQAAVDGQLPVARAVPTGTVQPPERP